MRSIAAATCGMVVLTCLLCGCEPAAQRGPGSLTDAAGPRALVARWHAALSGGDQAAYLECFTGSTDERVLALAVFDAVRTSEAFHQAVLKGYGPEGWRVIQASEDSRIDVFPSDPAWAARLTIVRTGDLAFIYLPRGRVPMHLVLDGGAWRIHAGSLVPPGVTARRAAEYLTWWAAALKGLVPQVAEGRLAAAKAATDFDASFKERVAPAEQPAAAAAVDALLAQ
jgi:hypothetical protein